MFTGIIEHVGTIVGLEATPRHHAGGALAHRVGIELAHLADGLRLGASVAVNGVCLTLAELRGSVGGFDAVPETWKHTTFGRLRVGDPVNLERALRVGGALDGHFVQGHVDGIGTVDRIDREQGQWKLWIATDADLMPAIVPKGSVALDGTSLTVVDAAGGRFSVALIPTTIDSTIIGRRQPGDQINIETDIIARLVITRLEALVGGAATGGLTLEKLRDQGFLS